MAKPHIRVLCVDDHRIVREGISLIISREQDMKVIGAVATGEEAVELYKQHRPDITLMDLRLRTMSGVVAIRSIKEQDPNARIVVLTMYEGDEDIRRAVEAGASAYLLKDTLPDHLVRVVREVFTGNRAIPPNIEALLKEHAAQRPLTSREVEVLELLAKGLRSKEIADRLGISEETVHVHLKNIYSKLNVTDRGSAVHVALRRGIVHIE